MRRIRWQVIVALLLAAAPLALAQPVQSNPRIGYTYPAGGKQGSSFEIVVGGQALDGVNEAHISGGGVRATIIEYVKPITQQQAVVFREKLVELEQKRIVAARPTGGKPSTAPAFTAEDEKQVAEIRKKLATFVRKPASPAIVETVTIQVVINPDAEPGQRELRLETPAGLTNPLVFCIGHLPEFSENSPKAAMSSTESQMTIPGVCNGRVMPGNVDRYRFKAVKGQRLVVAASARELIPYLADAVPGWFQATLALYDAKGNEVAYADHFRSMPDPVLYYEVPSDGEYRVEIRDALYRGREDFVYRVTIGEIPYITGIFPLGGTAGAGTTVELTGWNLPQAALKLDPTDKRLGNVPLTVRKDLFTSNAMPFAIDAAPDCLEHEPNNDQAGAQLVPFPMIVNGRIDHPGDVDVFRFEGRVGEVVIAEVYARRLNSPLDSVLKLTDAAGKQVALNDDTEDKGSGLNTHHADSFIRATLPATGAYYLHLADTQHKGGPEYAYRLRISRPHPDFELRVAPSSISVRGGSSSSFTVYALRKDGFAGEINLTLKNARGFTLSGAHVPTNTDQVRLTLTAPPGPHPEPISIAIEGRAAIAARDVVHIAVPAEDLMQAFAYHHLVPAKDLTVSVSGKGSNRGAPKVIETATLRIPAGGIARFHVTMPASTFLGKTALELSDPPDGISIRETNPTRDGIEIVLQCDAAKTKPGLKGNLIINTFLERTPPANAVKPKVNKRRIPSGTLPAMPFEVVTR